MSPSDWHDAKGASNSPQKRASRRNQKNINKKRKKPSEKQQNPTKETDDKNVESVVAPSKIPKRISNREQTVSLSSKETDSLPTKQAGSQINKESSTVSTKQTNEKIIKPQITTRHMLRTIDTSKVEGENVIDSFFAMRLTGVKTVYVDTIQRLKIRSRLKPSKIIFRSSHDDGNEDGKEDRKQRRSLRKQRRGRVKSEETVSKTTPVDDSNDIQSSRKCSQIDSNENKSKQQAYLKHHSVSHSVSDVLDKTTFTETSSTISERTEESDTHLCTASSITTTSSDIMNQSTFKTKEVKKESSYKTNINLPDDVRDRQLPKVKLKSNEKRDRPSFKSNSEHLSSQTIKTKFPRAEITKSVATSQTTDLNLISELLPSKTEKQSFSEVEMTEIVTTFQSTDLDPNSEHMSSKTVKKTLPGAGITKTVAMSKSTGLNMNSKHLQTEKPTFSGVKITNTVTRSELNSQLPDPNERTLFTNRNLPWTNESFSSDSSSDEASDNDSSQTTATDTYTFDYTTSNKLITNPSQVIELRRNICKMKEDRKRLASSANDELRTQMSKSLKAMKLEHDLQEGLIKLKGLYMEKERLEYYVAKVKRYLNAGHVTTEERKYLLDKIEMTLSDRIAGNLDVFINSVLDQTMNTQHEDEVTMRRK